MSIAYIIVTLVAAAGVAFSAGSALFHAAWVVQPLADYGVPRSWLPWLGTAKAAGAAGLLVGLFVPVIGVMAGVCLVLYFTGAVITVIRARWYSHVAYPLMYAVPVAAALALGFITGWPT
ncbi:MAG: DoxX family protein [Mycobacterium sp.]